jgi:hypothetical protein
MRPDMVDDLKSRLYSASASPSRPPGGGDQCLRADVYTDVSRCAVSLFLDVAHQKGIIPHKVLVEFAG